MWRPHKLVEMDEINIFISRVVSGISFEFLGYSENRIYRKSPHAPWQKILRHTQNEDTT